MGKVGTISFILQVRNWGSMRGFSKIMYQISWQRGIWTKWVQGLYAFHYPSMGQLLWDLYLTRPGMLICILCFPKCYLLFNSPISCFFKELIKFTNGRKLCLVVDREQSIEGKYNGAWFDSLISHLLFQSRLLEKGRNLLTWDTGLP